MTGPFFVEGAEPGDALLVRIDRMTPNRDTGWTFSVLAPNVVDPGAVASLPSAQARLLGHRRRRRAPLASPSRRRASTDWSVALAPMIGCFGVAPARRPGDLDRDQRPVRRQHGLPPLRPGRDRRLSRSPRPGALFFLGDGHACQGDGEIVGTGIETSFEIEFTVRVAKGKTIGWPRGEDADSIFAVGNARPLDQALQHATTEMLRWLGEDYGLDATEASHLLGQAVRYDVANVFNPAYSVACRLEKRSLDRPEERLRPDLG